MMGEAEIQALSKRALIQLGSAHEFLFELTPTPGKDWISRRDGSGCYGVCRRGKST